jgi:hypothetical protein
MSLANTNAPSTLFRALPSYADAGGGASVASVLNNEEEDSVIGREANCIKECKNCWSILKEGFIQRKMLSISSPNAKSSRRNGRRDLSDDDNPINDSSNTEALSPVAINAWPVLDWIMTIFELDEKDQENIPLSELCFTDNMSCNIHGNSAVFSAATVPDTFTSRRGWCTMGSRCTSRNRFSLLPAGRTKTQNDRCPATNIRTICSSVFPVALVTQMLHS